MFGVVETKPSGPPSLTRIRSNSQTARLPSGTDPGVTASKVVLNEHVDPIVVLAVVAQGTVTGKSTSWPVADSVWDGPFSLSVIRTVVVA